jgi:NADH dehydrogenase
MRVFLTGGTGFVGRYVADALLADGHDLRCLVRQGSEDGLDQREHERVEVVIGDIVEPDSLRGLMDGCDAVVHLVGIIEEKPSKGVTFQRVHVDGTRNVLDAARASGVERFVHMSANGARADAPSDYQTTKWEAETLVREAGFAHWTVFRPSIIFGDPGPGRPEFCSQLWRDLIKPFPVTPILGDGEYELQPVAVEAVAQGFTQALRQDENAAYCVAGRERFPFDTIVDIISRGAGIKPKPKVHQPEWLSRAAIKTLSPLGVLPISPAQFEMLMEGNTCDASAFRERFDVPDVPFEADRLGYVRRRA